MIIRVVHKNVETGELGVASSYTEEFQVLKNFKDALMELETSLVNTKLLETFTEAYPSYDYILADISANKMRLKGFLSDKSPKGYIHIPDYIHNYLNPECPYFILKKTEAEKLEEENNVNE
jgi:uncharacterized protein YutD